MRVLGGTLDCRFVAPRSQGIQIRNSKHERGPQTETNPTRVNPKSEYRNSKQTGAKINPKPENPKPRIRFGLVWNLPCLDHSNLFRASCFGFRAFYSPFLSLFTYASKRLSLVERWRGIAERRSGELLGPDEFLLAFEPLLEKDFDFAGPVGAKAHGADDRRHFRRGDGVA